MKEKIGLIAGNRDLPLLVARKARELGRQLFCAAIEGEADKGLESLAREVVWVNLGALKKMVDFFNDRQVGEIAMIGGISRDSMILNYQPDEMAISVMESIDDFHTDKILRAVSGKMAEFGLHLAPVAEILPELLAAPGLLTRTEIAADLLADLKIAWKVAKELGRLDVGQCAVVSDRITLALEGADGTDSTIRRGGSLAQKPVAVAKVVKPHQDLRLDPPVIGPETIKVMAEANVGALAIEAGKVLVVNMEETVALADRHNIALAAWTDESV